MLRRGDESEHIGRMGGAEHELSEQTPLSGSISRTRHQVDAGSPVPDLDGRSAEQLRTRVAELEQTIEELASRTLAFDRLNF